MKFFLLYLQLNFVLALVFPQAFEPLISEELVFFRFVSTATAQAQTQATAAAKAQTLAPDSTLKSFHLVFDLDWTLVYPLENSPKQPGPLDVLVEGKWYRIADSTGDVLESLSQLPNVKIHFFSGGKKSRNLELLKKIRLPSGKTALDIAQQTLHYDDLTEVDPKAKKFSDRWKKDLSKVHSDLERVLLIDDIENFSMPGQEKQLLWTGKTYNFYDQFSSVPKKSTDKWDPPTREEWLRERNKLIALRNEILDRLGLAQDGNDVFPRAYPRANPRAFRAGTCKSFFDGLIP